MDGLAIGAGFRVAPTLRLMIALTVLIHEIQRGITTSIIMKHAGYSQTKTLSALLIDTGCTTLGVLLSGFVSTSAFDQLISFTVDIFLYIGTNDLRPESHRRFNLLILFSTLLWAVTIPTLAIPMKMNY